MSSRDEAKTGPKQKPFQTTDTYPTYGTMATHDPPNHLGNWDMVNLRKKKQW